MPLWKNAQQPAVERRLGHDARWRCLERPARMLGEKLLDLLVVLLELERAGAVDEQAARSNDGCGAAQDAALDGRHHGEVARLQPPARIGVAPEGAGAGA